MKDFLFKHYLANQTTSFMNSLKELLTLASDKEVILHTEGNSQALFQYSLVSQEAIHYYHAFGKPKFPYQTWFDQIIVNDDAFHKLQLSKRCPFLYQDTRYYKLVKYFQQIEKFDPPRFEYRVNIEHTAKTQIIEIKALNHIAFLKVELILCEKEAFIQKYQIHPNVDGLFGGFFLILLSLLQKQVSFVTILLEENNVDLTLLKSLGFQNETLWHVLRGGSRLEIHDQKAFENKLWELKSRKIKPKLLLHSCCGPCSSAVLKKLANYFEISIYYYNPNIFPEAEYHLRLQEQGKIIEYLQLNIPLIVPPYNHQEYLMKIKGVENLPEGDKRCFACYALRMKKAAEYAKRHGFDFFTTTLSISPYKNAKKINEIGIALEKQFGILFLYSNFKLNNGYQQSVALSKQFKLYRQDYCGCEFSLKEFHKKSVE